MFQKTYIKQLKLDSAAMRTWSCIACMFPESGFHLSALVFTKHAVWKFSKIGLHTIMSLNRGANSSSIRYFSCCHPPGSLQTNCQAFAYTIVCMITTCWTPRCSNLPLLQISYRMYLYTSETFTGIQIHTGILIRGTWRFLKKIGKLKNLKHKFIKVAFGTCVHMVQQPREWENCKRKNYRCA